jgi:hypothetical protein
VSHRAAVKHARPFVTTCRVRCASGARNLWAPTLLACSCRLSVRSTAGWMDRHRWDARGGGSWILMGWGRGRWGERGGWGRGRGSGGESGGRRGSVSSHIHTLRLSMFCTLAVAGKRGGGGRGEEGLPLSPPKASQQQPTLPKRPLRLRCLHCLHCLPRILHRCLPGILHLFPLFVFFW